MRLRVDSRVEQLQAQARTGRDGGRMMEVERWREVEEQPPG